MTKKMNHSKSDFHRTAMRIASAAMIFLGLLSTAAAGARQPRQTPPTAEQILGRYVEAIGGLAALEKINNRVTYSKANIAAAGITMSAIAYQAKPNESYSVLESAATGKIESGTTGEVAWQISATAGPQIFEGKEKSYFLHINVFDRLANWRKAFSRVEAAGIENVAGVPCYKIIMTPQDLPSQTIFFDKASWLPIKIAMTVESQAGSIPIETLFSDYRAVNGVLQAHKSVIKSLGPDRTITVEKIEQNVDLPPDRFALPAEIKGLLKKNP